MDFELRMCLSFIIPVILFASVTCSLINQRPAKQILILVTSLILPQFFIWWQAPVSIAYFLDNLRIMDLPTAWIMLIQPLLYSVVVLSFFFYLNLQKKGKERINKKFTKTLLEDARKEFERRILAGKFRAVVITDSDINISYTDPTGISAEFYWRGEEKEEKE